MRFNTLSQSILLGLLASAPLAAAYSDVDSSTNLERRYTGSLSGRAAHMVRAIVPDIEKRHHSAGGNTAAAAPADKGKGKDKGKKGDKKGKKGAAKAKGAAAPADAPPPATIPVAAAAAAAKRDAEPRRIPVEAEPHSKEPADEATSASSAAVATSTGTSTEDTVEKRDQIWPRHHQAGGSGNAKKGKKPARGGPSARRALARSEDEETEALETRDVSVDDEATDELVARDPKGKGKKGKGKGKKGKGKGKKGKGKGKGKKAAREEPVEMEKRHHSGGTAAQPSQPAGADAAPATQPAATKGRHGKKPKTVAIREEPDFDEDDDFEPLTARSLLEEDEDEDSELDARSVEVEVAPGVVVEQDNDDNE